MIPSDKNTINLPKAFPLLGGHFSAAQGMPLDLTAANKELQKVNLDDTALFSSFIFDSLASHGKQFGYGGYLEPRAIYHRSAVFGTEPQHMRSIHLGLDVWAPADTAVYAPWDGEIHSFQDNDEFGNYGPTIILKHPIGSETIYSLFGHLSRKDLAGIYVGMKVQQGDALCTIGPFPENGNWPAHLHFQLIKDLQNNSGDYPGVCTPAEKDFYQENCPDPFSILFPDGLEE
ncbi:peptidoglycan DD-metalloendopeptidase family protein [Echinicola pacifica]|nr:peptidoglycan DD-metalloendopeptidase family protein [Echinicola pacifica]